MLANENLDLRRHDNCRFLLPLILHRSPTMEPTLSTTLHSAPLKLDQHSLGRQCSHFRVTPNSGQHEHRSKRSTQDPVSRFHSITNIRAQQRTQVFQRSRTHATHSLPVQPCFANIHTRVSSKRVNSGCAKTTRWESHTAHIFDARHQRTRWIRNFLQPFRSQHSENTACPPRWMSTLGGHTKPLHPKRCQQSRNQRPSPTVLVASSSVNWKNDVDDHTQCQRHRYCIRCIHLIPHPALQLLHRQFFWHLLPANLSHPGFQTEHNTCSPQVGAIAFLPVPIEESVGFLIPVPRHHRHGLEDVSKAPLCTGAWLHASDDHCEPKSPVEIKRPQIALRDVVRSVVSQVSFRAAQV